MNKSCSQTVPKQTDQTEKKKKIHPPQAPQETGCAQTKRNSPSSYNTAWRRDQRSSELCKANLLCIIARGSTAPAKASNLKNCPGSTGAILGPGLTFRNQTNQINQPTRKEKTNLNCKMIERLCDKFNSQDILTRRREICKTNATNHEQKKAYLSWKREKKNKSN